MEVAQVQIAIAEDYMDKMDIVVRRCKRAGLKVDQQFEAIGIVTGSINVERLDKLLKVKGVSAVEDTSEYQIAPPDSDIQ